MNFTKTKIGWKYCICAQQAVCIGENWLAFMIDFRSYDCDGHMNDFYIPALIRLGEENYRNLFEIVLGLLVADLRTHSNASYASQSLKAKLDDHAPNDSASYVSQMLLTCSKSSTALFLGSSISAWVERFYAVLVYWLALLVPLLNLDRNDRFKAGIHTRGDQSSLKRRDVHVQIGHSNFIEFFNSTVGNF